MKDWQREEIRRLTEAVKEEIFEHSKYMANTLAQLALAEKLITKTTVQIRIGLEPILHQLHIYDADNALVHQLAKDWKVTFSKRFSESWGYFTYKTMIDEIPVLISKIKDVPRCKIVPRTEMKETTVYESICGPEVKG